jgi:hypothetical protein
MTRAEFLQRTVVSLCVRFEPADAVGEAIRHADALQASEAAPWDVEELASNYTIDAVRQRVNRACELEREECAKIADAVATLAQSRRLERQYDHGAVTAALNIATSIRTRSNP